MLCVILKLAFSFLPLITLRLPSSFVSDCESVFASLLTCWPARSDVHNVHVVCVQYSGTRKYSVYRFCKTVATSVFFTWVFFLGIEDVDMRVQTIGDFCVASSFFKEVLHTALTFFWQLQRYIRPRNVRRSCRCSTVPGFLQAAVPLFFPLCIFRCLHHFLHPFYR